MRQGLAQSRTLTQVRQQQNVMTLAVELNLTQVKKETDQKQTQKGYFILE